MLICVQMAKKQKYYVVWDGLTPGIYDSWAKCQQQIKGYPNAKYKSYPSRQAAEEAYASGYSAPSKRSSKSSNRPAPLLEIPYEKNSISVDAACSGNPGIMEYRGVYTTDGTEIFRQGPFHDGTNNIGEFLALVHALAWLKKLGKEDVVVYSDSRTAMAWLRNKKAKTTLRHTSRNKKLFELIHRAEGWLRNNRYSNPVVKWPTEEWGEIPADFGRK